MPRTATTIDPLELEKLAMLHCTDEEIAAWFSISKRQFERRKQSPAFRETWERGRAKGRVSVRRRQMELLNGKEGRPAATMAIWLGKQLLFQRDVVVQEVTGENGGPVRVESKLDFDKLTKEQLFGLRDLLLKARTTPA